MITLPTHTYTANHEKAFRVRDNVQNMANRLLQLDYKDSVDTDPRDKVVSTERWYGVSVDGHSELADFAIRGTVNESESGQTSAEVQVLQFNDTATFSHGPKSLLDEKGNTIAVGHEYKIDAPGGTQTAFFNDKTGTITFQDEPVRMAAW
ncbi:hypothetical protein IV102_26340 [bacterium]|nr:hypothetical protein [bacterium]